MAKKRKWLRGLPAAGVTMLAVVLSVTPEEAAVRAEAWFPILRWVLPVLAVAAVWYLALGFRLEFRRALLAWRGFAVGVSPEMAEIEKHLPPPPHVLCDRLTRWLFDLHLWVQREHRPGMVFFLAARPGGNEGAIEILQPVNSQEVILRATTTIQPQDVPLFAKAELRLRNELAAEVVRMGLAIEVLPPPRAPVQAVRVSSAVLATELVEEDAFTDAFLAISRGVIMVGTVIRRIDMEIERDPPGPAQGPDGDTPPPPPGPTLD